METINEHIKTNQLKNVYLLYGEERALMLQFRDKLKEEICPDGDDMNITRFSGKGISAVEVADLANTLPFFAEHRLIIIEDSRWFTTSNDFAEQIKQFPDTTYLIFVEQEVDGRNKLFKAVSTMGYAANLKTPSPKQLAVKIVSQCKKEGKQITDDAVDYMLEQAGSSYGFLSMELEKVLSFKADADVITYEDVRMICTYQAEDKIFDMIDAIGNQNRERAMELYHDLLYLRKPVMQILSNLTRMTNMLLQISEMTRLNMDAKQIAAKTGLREWIVKKYKGQLKNYSYERLRDMLEACQEVDAGIKTGRYTDMIGVELLIVDFSTRRMKV
jgi:DNA polymerase-3 subunit delta